MDCSTIAAITYLSFPVACGILAQEPKQGGNPSRWAIRAHVAPDKPLVSISQMHSKSVECEPSLFNQALSLICQAMITWSATPKAVYNIKAKRETVCQFSILIKPRQDPGLNGSNSSHSLHTYKWLFRSWVDWVKKKKRLVAIYSESRKVCVWGFLPVVIYATHLLCPWICLGSCVCMYVSVLFFFFFWGGGLPLLVPSLY